jgi:hypothetical protein
MTDTQTSVPGPEASEEWTVVYAPAEGPADGFIIVAGEKGLWRVRAGGASPFEITIRGPAGASPAVSLEESAPSEPIPAGPDGPLPPDPSNPTKVRCAVCAQSLAPWWAARHLASAKHLAAVAKAAAPPEPFPPDPANPGKVRCLACRQSLTPGRAAHHRASAKHAAAEAKAAHR